MHHGDFRLPSRATGGREKIKRTGGRDWKGKQQNVEGCLKKIKERRTQTAGKFV